MTKISRRTLLQLGSGSLLMTLVPAVRAQTGSNTVVASRIWPASAYTRMTLETAGPVSYNQFMLSSPERLVVDIKGVALNAVLTQLSQKVRTDDPYIRSIRTGQFDTDTVRIVLDLKTSVNPQVFVLPPVADFKNRLVVDLYPAAALTKTQAESDPLMALLQDYNQGKISGDGSDIAAKGNTSAKPERQTPSIARVNRKPVIMLDPGHGGEDPGAIGPSGLREKDVVLAIARETKKRLDAAGYQTYMTRNEDIFIPLGVRVAKARKLKADLFVSIHADAFTNPSARGTGVYALSQRGATSASAKYLAQTQNEADQIGGVRFSNDKNVNNTLFDLTQTATINDSLKLGKKVLGQLGKINKLHKGDVDQANFAVLKAPDIPSILVETAFISNPAEEKQLADPAFRRQAAASITSGIREYLSTAVLARR